MSRIADDPYPGVRPFRLADHDRFFGRAKEAAAIAQRWQDNRLTVVSGPVASGKTSLLQAGVYPLMTSSRLDILSPGRCTYRPRFPFASLPRQNPYTLALLASWQPDELITRLAGLSVASFAQRRALRSDKIVYAAIDQAEDLLIDARLGSRRPWQEQLLADLAQAIDKPSRLHLLVITRDEAIGTLPAMMRGGAHYTVAPLTQQGAREAVTEPPRHRERVFADDAADLMVTDLRTSHIVPADGKGERDVASDLAEPTLLQVACRRLWQDLPPDRTVISAEDVRAFGDVDGAVAAFCGEVIAEVAGLHNLTTKWLRSRLVSAFVTDQGTGNRVIEGLNRSTAGMPTSLVRDLVDRHLLASELTSGIRWYGLLTDRLIEPLRMVPDELRRLPSAADYLHAAEHAQTLGDLDLARRHAEQTLRSEPDLHLRAEAESLLGNLAYELEKPAEAKERYAKAAALFEAVQDINTAALQLAAMGQMDLVQGQAAQAIEELRSAVSRVPNDPTIPIELALAIWQMGDGRGAVAILTGVLEHDGRNTEALRARGEILADLGDAQDAMLDLDRQALRDRPSTLAAHGLALAELGDHRAADREINDALDRAPSNGQVLLYAARASALSGDEIYSGELAMRAVRANDPPLSARHREQALRLVGNPTAG
jgi:tetratricopeptide (TPR) repeat protein